MAMFDVIGEAGIRPHGNRGRPDTEYLPNLKGSRAIKTYREMQDNNSVVGSSLLLMESTIAQVKWKAREKDNSDRCKEEAVFLDGVFDDMLLTFQELISDVVSFIPFGHSLFEINLKRRSGFSADHTMHSKFDDGRIGLRDLGIRPQETLKEWLWWPDGTLAGVFQQVTSSTEVKFIPAAKFVLFRTKSNRGNPEGRATLRPAYRPWYFLKRYEDIEGVSFDRNLQGVPVFYLPNAYLDATDADPVKKNARDRFALMLQQFHRNEMFGFLFPAKKDKDGDTGFDFDIKSVDTANVAEQLGKAIMRLQREIAVIFNTQFQWLGQNAVGRASVSGDQMDVYVLAMESILDIIQEMIDRYVVNPLYEMNGVPEEFRATLVHEPVHRDDLKQFCENMKGLLDAGAITGDAPLEDHIREKLSLPPRALEDELDVGVGISNLDGAGDPSDTPDGNAPGKPAPTEPNQEKPATVAQKLKWLDRLFGREVP